MDDLKIESRDLLCHLRSFAAPSACPAGQLLPGRSERIKTLAGGDWSRRTTAEPTESDDRRIARRVSKANQTRMTGGVGGGS